MKDMALWNEGDWIAAIAAIALFAILAIGGLIAVRKSEEVVGHPRGLFVLFYVLTAIGGSTGSFLFSNAASVGASGAIFGLMGAAVVVMRNRGINPMESGLGVWLGINLLFTFAIPGISIGGHLGGFVGGGVAAEARWQRSCSRCRSRPGSWETPWALRLRAGSCLAPTRRSTSARPSALPSTTSSCTAARLDSGPATRVISWANPSPASIRSSTARPAERTATASRRSRALFAAGDREH